MYNVRDMDWILKSMSIRQNDNKGVVKSNFVTSCLAFRGSILIGNSSLTHMHKLEGGTVDFWKHAQQFGRRTQAHTSIFKERTTTAPWNTQHAPLRSFYNMHQERFFWSIAHTIEGYSIAHVIKDSTLTQYASLEREEVSST